MRRDVYFTGWLRTGWSLLTYDEKSSSRNSSNRNENHELRSKAKSAYNTPTYTPIQQASDPQSKPGDPRNSKIPLSAGKKLTNKSQASDKPKTRHTCRCSTL